MTYQEVLDDLLLPLADLYESQIQNRVLNLLPPTVENYEARRECLAGLIAEQSVLNYQGTNTYILTPAGYLKYKDRITALRALSATV